VPARCVVGRPSLCRAVCLARFQSGCLSHLLSGVSNPTVAGWERRSTRWASSACGRCARTGGALKATCLSAPMASGPRCAGFATAIRRRRGAPGRPEQCATCAAGKCGTAWREVEAGCRPLRTSPSAGLAGVSRAAQRAAPLPSGCCKEAVRCWCGGSQMCGTCCKQGYLTRERDCACCR